MTFPTTSLASHPAGPFPKGTTTYSSILTIRRPGDVIASDASAVAVTQRRPVVTFPARPATHETTSSVMRWCVTVCVIVPRRLVAPQTRPLSTSDR